MPRGVKKTTVQMPEMKDFPSCRLGDKNGYVTLIQTNLKNRGYDIGKKGVDGVYGEKTKAAVKEFQKDIGMPVPNGSVGPKTWAALQESKVNRLPEKKAEPKPKVVPINRAQTDSQAPKGTFAYNPLTNQVEEVIDPTPAPAVQPVPQNTSPAPVFPAGNHPIVSQPVQKVTLPYVAAPGTCRVLVEGLTKFQAEVLVKMLSGGVSARIL